MSKQLRSEVRGCLGVRGGELFPCADSSYPVFLKMLFLLEQLYLEILMTQAAGLRANTARSSKVCNPLKPNKGTRTAPLPVWI